MQLSKKYVTLCVNISETLFTQLFKLLGGKRKRIVEDKNSVMIYAFEPETRTPLLVNMLSGVKNVKKSNSASGTMNGDRSELFAMFICL